MSDRTEVARLDIGEVIAASGLPASTLHLWERRGLITSTGRIGLRRQYDPEVIDRLAIIVLCQRTGFTLAEIAQLFAPDAFTAGKGLLENKLAALKAQRAELDAAIDGLEHALRCDHEATLDCPGFRSNLPGVLPVESRSSASPSD